MTSKIPPLPLPPNQYDQRYFNEVIRALNFYFRAQNNPAPAVFATIQLLELPTSDTGLAPGQLWRDSTDNTLKIVPDADNVVRLIGQGVTVDIGGVGV